MKGRRLVRAIAVVIGPSLALELLAAASLVSTVRALLSKARGESNPRPLRSLALMGTIASWLYLTLVRPWHLRWGATEEEVRIHLINTVWAARAARSGAFGFRKGRGIAVSGFRRIGPSASFPIYEVASRKPLPGDEMSPQPSAQSTHAITVEAPLEGVWPWLMQLGQGRGGWYSYGWLENLDGLEIHTRDRVVPELQLEVGDPVRWGLRSSRRWPGASGRSSRIGL